MMSILVFAFASLVTVVAAAGGVYLLYARQQLKLRELELQAADRVAPKPDLPAYVDAGDPASIAAWKKAQTELDTSW